MRALFHLNINILIDMNREKRELLDGHTHLRPDLKCRIENKNTGM
jgi:hypothetical protein